MKTNHTDPFLGNLDIPFLESHYTGKVREVYVTHDPIMATITTNRISAFDRILPRPIPYKGAVLNTIAFHFLQHAKTIVPVWADTIPHPQVTIGRKADSVFKVEFIVRGYNCGSFHKNYVAKGHENPWGIKIPKSMKENDKFPEPVFTPTTKEDGGQHDADISEKEILEQGLMTAKDLERVKEYSFALFEQGTNLMDQCGLILVDTKYEFGKIDGGIYLIDEVHTPDSSRFFYKENYEENQRKGLPQKHLSKEFVREWLKENNFTGQDGQVIPEMTDEKVLEISERYLELYKAVIGHDFPKERIETDEVKAKAVIEEKTKQAIARYRLKEFFDGRPAVGITMGSKSDWPVMKNAADILEQFGIPYVVNIISAHRTPEDLSQYAKKAEEKEMKVIIAGAGGAAHLPGMLAAYSPLPIIGVPINSSNSIKGIDSLLSEAQMPKGVPVLVVGIDRADNAGLSAVRILGIQNEMIRSQYIAYQQKLKTEVNKGRKELIEVCEALEL